ncbi:MAG: hypothetical protein ABFS38_06325 [Bacteroidota bacterium]
MKKLFAFALVAVFSIPLLQAQESMFDVGDGVVNLGLGIGNTLYLGGYGYSTGVPPISISYEQGILDDILEKGVIGVGGYIGYTSYKFRDTWLGSDWGWNISNTIIGALGTFHYPLLDKLDTYAGITLGYNINTWREYGDIPGGSYSSSSSGLAASGFIGGRYYFNEKFAAFAQVGYGIAYLTFGVSIKL